MGFFGCPGSKHAHSGAHGVIWSDDESVAVQFPGTWIAKVSNSNCVENQNSVEFWA
jgi:hypothetical protein